MLMFSLVRKRPADDRSLLAKSGGAQLLCPFLYGILLMLGACGTVAPYQREDLARPCMDLSQEMNEVSFRAHVHDSREAATGGHGSTGGGCGCN